MSDLRIEFQVGRVDEIFPELPAWLQISLEVRFGWLKDITRFKQKKEKNNFQSLMLPKQEKTLGGEL